MNGVKALRVADRQLPQLQRQDPEPGLFDALNDLPVYASLDGVWLDDGERRLHIRPILSRTHQLVITPLFP